MTESFEASLRTLLRVPYPLIFVTAPEEELVLDLLAHDASRLGRKLWSWSTVTGLVPASQHGRDPRPSSERSLRHALEEIAQLDGPGIFALCEPAGELDSTAQRHLVELSRRASDRSQTVLIVATHAPVPATLAHEATALVAPLPDRGRLGEVLARALPADRYRLLPRENMIAAALGLTRREAGRAFTRVRVAHQEAGAPLVFDWEARVLDEKQRAINKDDIVTYIEVGDDLTDVGGLDVLKRWLDTRRAAFSQEARDYGLPAPKGLLLTGIQGCGKSLTAKAVASHWRLPLLRLDLGAVFGGEHAPDAAINRALSIAEAIAPSVLWTDEIEKGFAADSSGMTMRVLGTLLTWLQEKSSEVFFVATANEVMNLPPELLRKGRFDELFFVDLPDRHARSAILEIHLRKHGRDPDAFDLDALAEAADNFSGAELEQVVVAALYESFAEARELESSDLARVIEDTVPLFNTREDDIKALREWARLRARHAANDQSLVDLFQ